MSTSKLTPNIAHNPPRRSSRVGGGVLLWLLVLLLAACGSAAPAPPTRIPTASPAPQSTISNPAGFSLRPPQGWQVTRNEGMPDLGGIVAVAPPDAHPDMPEQAILVNVGESLFLIPRNPTPADTPDTILDVMLASLGISADTPDDQVSTRYDRVVAGVPARLVDIQSTGDDGSITRSSIVVARVDEQRWLMVYASAPTTRWDQQQVQAVLDSLRVFEPQLELTPLYPVPASAENVSRVGNQMSFVIWMSIEDLLSFYRDRLGEAGAVEDLELTNVTDDSFRMVFYNWPRSEGRALVVQGGTLVQDGGAGSAGQVVVTIRLE